jgi:hypothetical protein
MANQVTLTFAGETKQVEDSFSRVGESSKRMGSAVEESGDGFRKAGEAADEVDTKAMGFRGHPDRCPRLAQGRVDARQGSVVRGVRDPRRRYR